MVTRDQLRQGYENLPLMRGAGVAFGVVFATVGGLGVRTGVESLGWAQAPAHIVRSDKVGIARNRGARVTAIFRVGALGYECKSVRIGRDNMWSDADRYPKGLRTTVAYDPTNLRRCALEPGVSGGSLAFLGVGLGCLAMAAYAHRKLGAQRMAAAGVGTVA